MKGMVVYASMYGNTKKIAQAIAEAIANDSQVKLADVGDVRLDDLKGLDFLVVGSATQKFTALPEMKALLTRLPAGALDGVQVGVFDTRFFVKDMKSLIGRFFVGTFGYAAKPLMELLVARGGKAVLPPEGFGVLDSEGPIKAGELERAAAWGHRFISALAS